MCWLRNSAWQPGYYGSDVVHSAAGFVGLGLAYFAAERFRRVSLTLLPAK